MARTKRERYQQAIDYIAALDAGLGADVAKAIEAQVDDGGAKEDALLGAGAEISLKGAGFWNKGTKDQHAAVRALLLCILAYYRPPYAAQEYASAFVLGQVRTGARNTSKMQVDAHILEFLPLANPTLDDVATAAEQVKEVRGVVDYLQRRRSEIQVSSAPVCYHGVLSWLFTAGVVSKRWLAKKAMTITAYTANAYLGDGVVLDDPADWARIPRGYLWNIHRAGDKTTCHWGVSLGDGRAAACNNTDESPFKKLAYETDLAGRVGDTFYGVFNMAEICEVLAGTVKYGHSGSSAPKRPDNIVVRAINPLREDSYF